MLKIIKDSTLVPTPIVDLKLDSEPRLGSTDPVTSEGVKNAIDGAVGDASEALQQQIDDIAEKAGSGYIPKGEASVATLNGLSGQENGWLYTMTDAGTLTLGSLAVVAGDTVAWDEANSVWYKAMDYAPAQYGTNEVHNLATTATEADLVAGNFLALDVPGVGGVTKKVPGNLVAPKSVQDELVENVGYLVDEAFLEQSDFWTATTISNTGVESASTTRISSKPFIITDKTSRKIYCTNRYWVSRWNADGSFIDLYVVDPVTPISLPNGIYRLTAHYADNRTIDSSNVDALIESFSFKRNLLTGENIEPHSIIPDNLKENPFAEHNILNNPDLWTKTTINSSGVELPNNTRITSSMLVITDDTPKTIYDSKSSVLYWVSEFNADGTFKSNYADVGYRATLTLPNGYFKITACKDNNVTIDDTQFALILAALRLDSKKLDGKYIDDRTIGGEKIKSQSIGGREIKDYPFAEHNILNNDDFWSATTISNTGVESASTTRISSAMIEITSDTPNTIKNSSGGSVEYWVSKYGSDGTFVETSTIVGYYPSLTLATGYYRITARKSNNATIDATEKANILAALSLLSKCMDGSKIERDSIPADRIKGGSDVSMLKGKSVLNLGDSIANGAGDNSGGAYAKYIAAKNSMRLYTYAVNGMVLAEGGSDTTSSRLSQQITSAIAGIPNDVTPDFILFEGGTNDISTNVTLGDLVSDVNAYGEYVTTGCDTDTYCGAFEVAVNRLRTQWPSASIIFIMVHEMTSRDIAKQQQFHEKQLALCKKWKIPFVDMFNEGQMTSLITATAQNFFPTSSGTPTGYDRTHPNELGYKKFYCPKIEAKMRETCGWDVQ